MIKKQAYSITMPVVKTELYISYEFIVDFFEV